MAAAVNSLASQSTLLLSQPTSRLAPRPSSPPLSRLPLHLCFRPSASSTPPLIPIRASVAARSRTSRTLRFAVPDSGGGEIGGGGGAEGGGGGGGSGDRNEGSGSPEDGERKKMGGGMSMSQKITLGYAALVGGEWLTISYPFRIVQISFLLYLPAYSIVPVPLFASVTRVLRAFCSAWLVKISNVNLAYEKNEIHFNLVPGFWHTIFRWCQSIPNWIQTWHLNCWPRRSLFALRVPRSFIFWKERNAIPISINIKEGAAINGIQTRDISESAEKKRKLCFNWAQFFWYHHKDPPCLSFESVVHQTESQSTRTDPPVKVWNWEMHGLETHSHTER